MITEQLQTHAAYTLEENEKYLGLAVKTLLEQNESLLLEARMIVRNGKERIIYHTAGMESYGALFTSVSPALHQKVVESIFQTINVVRNMPFWEKDFLDLRREHIYIDSINGNVKFTVVPRIFLDQNDAKIEWTENLIAVLTETLKLVCDDPRMRDIKSKVDAISNMPELIDRHLQTEKLIDAYANSFHVDIATTSASSVPLDVVLEYSGQAGHFSFVDSIDEFIMGKESQCNGIINISPAISRKHCKIVRDNAGYKIADIGSTNGTWVNGVRLSPNSLYELKDGDEIKLADIALRTRFEY